MVQRRRGVARLERRADLLLGQGRAALGGAPFDDRIDAFPPLEVH
jgi:hypothetical protein